MATSKNSAVSIVDFFKNAFFPKFCFGCGRIGTYLCTTCTHSLRLAEYDIYPTHKKIGELDGFISFFRYEGLTKKIIMKLKYHLIHDAAQDIVDAVNPLSLQKIYLLKKNSPELFFLPVPLHIKRTRDRGFNQSEKLFKILGEKIGIPVKNNVVIRKRYTIPQAHMKTKHDRTTNIVGAFSVVKNVTNTDIIICDDVWTTGSTIKELCKELKRNGARKVYALTIARVYV